MIVKDVDRYDSVVSFVNTQIRPAQAEKRKASVQDEDCDLCPPNELLSIEAVCPSRGPVQIRGAHRCLLIAKTGVEKVGDRRDRIAVGGTRNGRGGGNRTFGKWRR